MENDQQDSDSDSTASPKAKSDKEAADYLHEYRQWLVAAEQKTQESFDKTVLALSGGALGISFVFLRDVIGNNPIALHHLLLAAWVVWGVSMFCVLASHYLSQLSLRYAIKQVDENSIHDGKPGGIYATYTAALNVAGALFLLAGIVFITVFVGANISSSKAQSLTTGIEHEQESIAASAAESGSRGGERIQTPASASAQAEASD